MTRPKQLHILVFSLIFFNLFGSIRAIGQDQNNETDCLVTLKPDKLQSKIKELADDHRSIAKCLFQQMLAEDYENARKERKGAGVLMPASLEEEKLRNDRAEKLWKCYNDFSACRSGLFSVGVDNYTFKLLVPKISSSYEAFLKTPNKAIPALFNGYVEKNNIRGYLDSEKISGQIPKVMKDYSDYKGLNKKNLVSFDIFPKRAAPKCTDKKQILFLLQITSTTGNPDVMLDALKCAREGLLDLKGYARPGVSSALPNKRNEIPQNLQQLTKEQIDFIKLNPIIDRLNPLDLKIEALYQENLKKAVSIQALKNCDLNTDEVKAKRDQFCKAVNGTKCTDSRTNLTSENNNGKCTTTILTPEIPYILDSLSGYNPNPQTIKPGDLEPQPENPFLSNGSDTPKIEEFMGKVYADAMTKAIYNFASLQFKYKQNVKIETVDDVKVWMKKNEAFQNIATFCADKNPKCKSADGTSIQEGIFNNVAQKLYTDIKDKKIAYKTQDSARRDLCNFFRKPDVKYPFADTAEFIDLSRAIKSRSSNSALDSENNQHYANNRTSGLERTLFSDETTAIRKALRDDTPNSDAMLLLSDSLSSIGTDKNNGGYAQLTLNCTNTSQDFDATKVGRAIDDAEKNLRDYIKAMNSNIPDNSLSDENRKHDDSEKLESLIALAPPQSIGNVLLNDQISYSKFVCEALRHKDRNKIISGALSNSAHFVADVAGGAMMLTGFLEPEGVAVKIVGQYAADFLIAGAFGSAVGDLSKFISANFDEKAETMSLSVVNLGDSDDTIKAKQAAQSAAANAISALQGDALLVASIGFSEFTKSLQALKNPKPVDINQALGRFTGELAKDVNTTGDDSLTEHVISVTKNHIRVLERNINILKMEVDGYALESKINALANNKPESIGLPPEIANKKIKLEKFISVASHYQADVDASEKAIARAAAHESSGTIVVANELMPQTASPVRVQPSKAVATQATTPSLITNNAIPIGSAPVGADPTSLVK